jgi:dienelactone hydrolase
MSIGVMAEAAPVDYSAAGPEAFTTTDFANGTAGTLGGKLVVPNRAGKFPLLVNTHGFSGNAAQQLGWGEHFASYGFVAVVPSMPGGVPTDHKANGDIIRALALLFSDPTYVSPAQGKVDAERIGLSGHSAGGLQTTFAASLLKPRATLLFDPVDNMMTGRPVYATLCSPVMAIFAEPGACNNQAEWTTFKNTSIGPQVLLDVIGSNHCDPINPAMVGCDLLCGGVSSAQNQANYSRYATAYFLAYLKDDVAAAATITQSALAGDTALRSTSVRDAPNCALGPSDGGLDAGDDAALRADAVTPPDGTAPSDAMRSDAPAPSDAALDIVMTVDARSDAGNDVGTPIMDAAREASADATTTPEPPASDAGSPIMDSSLPPPVSDGGTPDQTTPKSPAQTSGCDCVIASRPENNLPRSLAAILVGAAALVIRRARRERREKRRTR